MTMTIREAFEKGTAAFNAHDIGEFASILADDVMFHVPGGMSGKGKEACAQYHAGWLDAFPDAHVEIHALHISGDVAVEEGTFTGTHRGVLHTPAGDVPPTGRRLAADYIQVLHFRDGMTTSFNLMYDRLELLEQLGLVPSPAASG
jgi:predicted ester cyclase